MTFKQLSKIYNTASQRLIEITNKAEAKTHIDSKAYCCWRAGEKIGDTGWIRLASPSLVSKNDVRPIFVCKASLVD